MLCFTLNLKLHVRTSFPEKHSNSSMQQSNVKSIVVASVHTVNVWKAKDTKKFEWTSVLGGEKRTLLRKLPDQFSKILPPDRAPTVQRLWTVS